jgi:uncharacterized protein YbbK (DUF523 family)
MTADGADVTDHYIAGANHALAEARAHGATQAVLKARSPSCGKGDIYDGSFSRVARSGDGVTAALLEQSGVTVRSEEEI